MEIMLQQRDIRRRGQKSTHDILDNIKLLYKISMEQFNANVENMQQQILDLREETKDQRHLWNCQKPKDNSFLIHFPRTNLKRRGAKRETNCCFELWDTV